MTTDKTKTTPEVSVYSSSVGNVQGRVAEPPRMPVTDRYPPVSALAGEQLLARSGFQPYRPEDR